MGRRRQQKPYKAVVSKHGRVLMLLSNRDHPEPPGEGCCERFTRYSRGADGNDHPEVGVRVCPKHGRKLFLQMERDQ